MVYGLDHQEFEPRLRQQNVLSFKAPRPVLKSTQPSIQWVRGSMPGREVNDTIPSIADVENCSRELVCVCLCIRILQSVVELFTKRFAALR